MAKTFTTGLVITGDAGGGVRAIKSTHAELQRLDKGFNNTGQQSRTFQREIQNTSTDLDTFASRLRPLAGLMAGVFAVSTLKDQIDFADSLHKMNLRIGAGAEALSEYKYVAAGAGVEFNTLATAWQRQTRRIAEAAAGTGVAKAALDELGLSAKELNQLSPEQQFERIAAALESIENPGQKAALAMKMWDTEGVKLLQITNQGTAAMAEQREEARALGQTISQQTAADMAAFGDSLDRVKAIASGTTDTLLAQLIPSVTRTIDSFTDYVKDAGGVAAVTDKLTTGATILAAVYGGRLVGSVTAKTAATIQSTLAERAAAAQTAARVAQDKMAEAQTARRMVGEQTAAVTSARIAAQRAQQAQVDAAERLRAIQITQQQMVAERQLEVQRLQAQISATGRQQSLTRLADIRLQETALTAQQTGAERALTSAKIAATSATRRQASAELDLAKKIKVADAAMRSSAASSHAASAAQVVLTGTTRALGTAMAFLGGPAGVIFLAGSALLMFAANAKDASLSADELAASIETASEKLQQMTSNQLLANRLKITDLLAELDDEIMTVKGQMETLNVDMQRTPGSKMVDEWGRELTKLGGVLDDKKQKAEGFREKLAEIEDYLNGERPAVKIAATTSKDKTPKAKSQKDNTESLRSQAQKYLLELERLNATEQQQVAHWRADSLAQTESYFKQGLINARDYEFAKVSIAEEAARRLQAIEDKRWDKYTKNGIGTLGQLSRDAENIEGPRGELIRGGVAKEIADQTFKGLPAGGGINPKFDTGFGEANRLEQEREKMLAAYDERIAEYQSYRELELENAELYDEQLAALRDKRNEQELAADQAIMQAKLAGAQSTFGSLTEIAGTFAGKQSGIYKAMFLAEKGFGIARSMVAIQTGIAQAAAVPFPGNIDAMASVAAATSSIVSTISSVAMPDGQAHDGLNYVPNSGTWNLQKGERITGAALNQDLTKFLERENKAQGAGAGKVEITQHFHIEGGSAGMDPQTLQALYRTAKQATQEVINHELRPGGRLSR